MYSGRYSRRGRAELFVLFSKEVLRLKRGRITYQVYTTAGSLSEVDPNRFKGRGTSSQLEERGQRRLCGGPLTPPDRAWPGISWLTLRCILPCMRVPRSSIDTCNTINSRYIYTYTSNITLFGRERARSPSDHTCPPTHSSQFRRRAFPRRAPSQLQRCVSIASPHAYVPIPCCQYIASWPHEYPSASFTVKLHSSCTPTMFVPRTPLGLGGVDTHSY